MLCHVAIAALTRVRNRRPAATSTKTEAAERRGCEGDGPGRVRRSKKTFGRKRHHPVGAPAAADSLTSAPPDSATRWADDTWSRPPRPRICDAASRSEAPEPRLTPSPPVSARRKAGAQRRHATASARPVDPYPTVLPATASARPRPPSQGAPQPGAASCSDVARSLARFSAHRQ